MSVPSRANVAKHLASEDLMAEAVDGLRVAVPRQGAGKEGKWEDAPLVRRSVHLPSTQANQLEEGIASLVTIH